MLPNLESFGWCNHQPIEAFVVGDKAIKVGWLNCKFDVATSIGIYNLRQLVYCLI